MWIRFTTFFIVLYSSCRQCTVDTTNVTNVSEAPKGFGMRFRLPFIDMEIQSVSNLKIIKDAAGQQVFVLHGAEFYRLILGRESKRMTLIATLGGDVKDSELLGAEIISWSDYYLLVIAIEEHLEVYQFAKKTIVERTQNPVNKTIKPLVMDPIQQITLYGQYRKIFLCEPTESGIFLIVLVDFTKMYSRLNTYEWSETYFNPSEEMTIPPVQVIKLIGLGSKYLVISRMSKSQTMITVIVYSVTSSLEQVQTMQLPSESIHPFTYQGINYFLACSAGRTKCTSFKMSDEQFAVYKHRSASEFFFNQFTAGEHYLVGQRMAEVLVYVDARMECYGAFKTNTTNITSILTHLNEEGNDFILLNYIHPSSALVRIIEIEYEGKVGASFEDIDEIGSALKQQKHAFEESINKLRNLLLSRKYSFDEIKKYIASIGAKAKQAVFKNPLKILSGQIGIVKLLGSKLRGPLQILKTIESLSNGERKGRFSRGFDRNGTKNFDLKVRNLRVGNLIYDGDLIKGFNLSSDGNLLHISTPVTTQTLETKELLTATVMESRKDRQFFSRSFRSLGESKISARQLRVNRINGIPWDHFYQNLFLRSRDRSLSGRLILQADVQIDSLWTPILNGLQTDKLFNLVEVQNVTSDVVISRFYVSDLTVDSLNGLDFARDIARKGVENFIKTPVIAQDIIITGKLILSEKDHQARHVFGTDVLDFQQTYTGKVVIDGSLTLSNVMIEDGMKSRIFVDGKTIPENIAHEFWMHSVPQAFENPVSLTNCHVSAPSLNVLHLNNRHISEYLLSTDPPNPNPVLLIFLSAHIEGNLIADSMFGTKLRQISKHALMVGDQMIVSGETFFEGGLTFDQGEVAVLNDMSSSDLVSMNERNFTFTGKKSFKSLHVTKEAVITKNLDINLLNGVLQVHDLFKTDNRFGTVVLRSLLRANNVVFNYLNGFPSKKLLNSIHSFEDKLILRKDLFIEGNIQFESNLEVDTINNIAWEDYLRSLIRINENTVINGTKTIASTLSIDTELKVPMINEVAIEDLFKNILFKSQNQEISGSYTFDTVQINNVDVPYVNEFPTTAFIDTRSPEVIFNCDISVNKLQVHGSLFGGLDIDFYSLETRMKAMTLKPRKNLHVLGNAYWPWGNDQQSLDLQYIHTNAVRHLDDQVITGNVKLKKPLISTMKTKQIFPPDIDFDYIVRDCLFYNSSIEEIVTAAKVFLKPIHVAEATSLGHMGSAVVNRIDILQFNASLYRLNKPSLLYEPLIFKVPPIFGQLTVLGTINGVLPNNIFLAHAEHVWPPVKLQSLYIERDLKLFDIVEMSLDFLLKNRIRKSGMGQEVFGHLTFEHLVLKEEIYMQSINGITIDNLVQKNSSTIQEISGPKTILGDLQLLGPTMIVRLNDVNIVERYRKTIFLNRDHYFDGLSIENVKFENGLIVNASKHSFNDKPENSSYKEALQQHRETLKKIEISLRAAENIIEAKAMNPKKLVYLDYDFSTIIERKSTNDSIQEQFIFDNNRYQYCDREQTIIKWSKYHNRISLSKTITNTVAADEYGVRVTAENICKDSFRNVNSRISITEPHFKKRFTINKLVHSIEIFYASEIFVLVHAIDMYAGNNEIRILKIDSNLKTIQDWQLLTDGVGKVSRLFKLQSHTILVVSTIIDNYPSITIYDLHAESQIFEVIQVIDGDFDVIELAQVTPHSYHLFLSCVHCQRIVIFEYDTLSSSVENCHMYHIYQIIKLKTRIDRFHLFTLDDGGIYLLVLADLDIDFYHIYKYRYIEGWKHYTYGYFKNIQNAYPLLKGGLSSVDDNLLLLCNRKCTLVKAFYQG